MLYVEFLYCRAIVGTWDALVRMYESRDELDEMFSSSPAFNMSAIVEPSLTNDSFITSNNSLLTTVINRILPILTNVTKLNNSVIAQNVSVS